MAKTEYTKIVTKAGEAFYAHLREPEIYEGKELGYSIQLKLNKEDTDELMSQIEAELEKAKSEMKLKPGRKWSKEPFMGFKTDKDGDIVFKFRYRNRLNSDFYPFFLRCVFHALNQHAGGHSRSTA